MPDDHTEVQSSRLFIAGTDSGGVSNTFNGLCSAGTKSSSATNQDFVWTAPMEGYGYGEDVGSATMIVAYDKATDGVAQV